MRVPVCTWVVSPDWVTVVSVRPSGTIASANATFVTLDDNRTNARKTESTLASRRRRRNLPIKLEGQKRPVGRRTPALAYNPFSFIARTSRCRRRQPPAASMIFRKPHLELSNFGPHGLRVQRARGEDMFFGDIILKQ